MGVLEHLERTTSAGFLADNTHDGAVAAGSQCPDGKVARKSERYRTIGRTGLTHFILLLRALPQPRVRIARTLRPSDGKARGPIAPALTLKLLQRLLRVLILVGRGQTPPFRPQSAELILVIGLPGPLGQA